MKINEIFNSFQGEGRDVGEAALFIRFAGCPIKCKFCDTKRAWGDKGKDYSVSELLSIIWTRGRVGKYLIVFTGGEPAIVRSRDWDRILKALEFRSCGNVSIETSGIKIPRAWKKHGWFVHFIVSPKKKAYDEDGEKYIKNLKWFKDKTSSSFKFVVKDTDDLSFVSRIIRLLKLEGNKVILMPEGTNIRELRKSYKVLEGFALMNNYRISDRAQITLGFK